MGYENVLEYQDRLVKNYKYRPLPTMFSEEARALYKDNIPEGFCLDGGNVALYGASGLKIANGYNRIVIGDYGAYVEIMPEDMAHENIVVKKGQEYRDNDERYSGKVKYSWLTLRDDSDVKIYFQKREVAYADYVPGRYYVSVYECVPQKIAEKENVVGGGAVVTQEMIDGWLKEYGVYSSDLSKYYLSLVQGHVNALDCAIQHKVPPYELELWLCIADVFEKYRPLSYEQYQAISYNLNAIGCVRSELCGKLEALAPEVQIAIEMGLEGLEFPYRIQNLPVESLRALLQLPAEDLLCVSKFSKVVAGQKAEQQLDDVDGLIKAASARVQDSGSRQEEYELVN